MVSANKERLRPAGGQTDTSVPDTLDTGSGLVGPNGSY